jgi:tetratricopeptide (TPR) repeat protein
MPPYPALTPTSLQKNQLSFALRIPAAWQRVAGVAIIVALAVIAYLPSIRGGFVLDDDQLLTENRLIHAPDGLSRAWFSTDAQDYWPVTFTSFWLEWQCFGKSPTGYHVTNLALHIAAALLIWRILSLLSIPGAFLAAALFTVHPINVESVAWIAQRKNTLSIVFYLLAILWFLKSDKARTGSPSKINAVGSQRWLGWYLLSMFSFLLGMLSKGSIAILPAVLLWIIWWQRPITRRDLRLSAPFFVIAAALVAVNIWFQTHGSGEVVRHAGLPERIAAAGAITWFYLGKALVPIDLCFIYPLWNVRPTELLWWLPLGVAIAVTVLLWRTRTHPIGRAVLFAWGYFCLALLPVIGLIDVGYMKFSLVADHYLHIALIGPVALIAAALARSMQGERTVLARTSLSIAIAIVALFTIASREQSAIYASDVQLYEATLAKNPNAWLARINLGAIHHRSGQAETATQEFRQAIESNPDYADAHYNLGVVLFETGHADEAIAELEKAIALDPRHWQAHNNLGFILQTRRQDADAIERFNAALAIDPEYTRAHYNLASSLLVTGRASDAVSHYATALRLKPDYADAAANLAVAYAATGDYAAAVKAAENALVLARSQKLDQLARALEQLLRMYRARLP